MTQTKTLEELEIYFLALWDKLKTGEDPTPDEISAIQTYSIQVFPYIAQMELSADRVWHEESKEVSALSKNPSEFKRNEELNDSYFRHKFITKQIDRMTSYQISLASKNKNQTTQWNNAGKS
jgi:hypothetical protein